MGLFTCLMGYDDAAVTLIDETLHGGVKKKTDASIYGPSTVAETTLSASVVKAAALYHAAQAALTESAVVNRYADEFRLKGAVISSEENLTRAEIQTDEEIFDLCIYNEVTGSVKACTLDRERNVTSKFTIGYGKRNGTVILLAMFPTILKDKEAKKLFDQLTPDFFQNGAPTEEDVRNLAILSDNIYYRLKTNILKLYEFDYSASEHTVNTIQRAAIDAGAYSAKSSDTILGFPQIFAGTGDDVTSDIGSTTIKAMPKSYAFDRTLSEYEKRLVPHLRDDIRVPSFVMRTLKLIKGYSKEDHHVRNILYYGEAGSGKSLASQMVAQGVQLPHLVFSCSPNTSELDLIGQIIPRVGNVDNSMVKKLKTIYNFPTTEDVHFNKKGIYEKLTGKEMPEDMSDYDVSVLVDQRRNQMIKQLASSCKENKDFEFVPSPIIQALVNGWVVEIQEIANIKDPGALTVLNQLLEIQTGGSHRLITGETITRHPDAIIICTTNVEYAGCRAINQSVLDRMNYAKEIATPSVDQLVDIVSLNTKCKNTSFIRSCVLVMNQIREYLTDAGIDDGVVGVRSVIDWVDNVMKLGDINEGAKETIISKATFDTDVQKYLYSEYVEKTTFPIIETFEETCA